MNPTETHTLTRYPGGRLDGYVVCRGDQWRVRWISLTSGRELPKPINQEQLARREARCGCCGRSIPLDGVAVIQHSPEPQPALDPA